MQPEFIEYIPVLETHNAGDRVFISSILDAEGIDFFIQGEYVAPYLFNALPMRVMVRAGQVEKARAILNDLDHSYTYRSNLFEGK